MDILLTDTEYQLERFPGKGGCIISPLKRKKLSIMRSLFIFVLVAFTSCNSKEKKTVEVKPLKTISKDSVHIYPHPPFVKDTTNVLDGIEREMTIEYTVWGCACANWITKEDRAKYGGGLKHHFFLEPVNDSLGRIEENINALDYYIVVKGQFYKKEDYPENVIQSEEPLEKARVFRYYDIRSFKKR